MITARVLADSSTLGVRLTTLEVTFPRFILAELNTHRMLSRNSASSRAIPPEKHIERIANGEMFVPTFGSRVKGMGQGDDLSQTAQESAQWRWRMTGEKVATDAQVLLDLGVDKSHVNRMLEPYLFQTAIISATEWDNFFALRCHPAAQQEIQETAIAMSDAIELSCPKELRDEDWHLPLVNPDELDDRPREFWALVSAGRCARVSFDTHNIDEDPQQSHDRARALAEAGHWSPFEHVAVVRNVDPWPTSNFSAPWLQCRKLFPNEAVFRG